MMSKCVCCMSVQYYIKSYIVWVMVRVHFLVVFNVAMLFEIVMHLKEWCNYIHFNINLTSKFYIGKWSDMCHYSYYTRVN